MASPTDPTHIPIPASPASKPSAVPVAEAEEMFANPLNPSHSLLRSETERTFLSHPHISLIFPSAYLSTLPTYEIEKILHIFIACGMLSPTTADEKNPTEEFKVWAEGLLGKFMRASGKVDEALLAKTDLQLLQVSIFLATEAAAGKAEFEASGKQAEEVGEGLYKTIRDGTLKQEEAGMVKAVKKEGEEEEEEEEVSEVLLGKLGWGLRFIVGMVVYCYECGERLEIEYINK